MLPRVEGPHLFVHLYVGGCLCCFRVLAVTNVLLSMPTCVRFYVNMYFHFLGESLMAGAELLGRVVTVCVRGPARKLFLWYAPSSVCPSLVSLFIVCISGSSRSLGEVLYYYELDFHFPPSQ